jgi:AcrR family transcriptional regulator
MQKPQSTYPRGDRRRSELLRAAIECLVDEGWVGLTHRRVAQRADANPGLVRYHFGNLAGLREAVARWASAELTVPLGEVAGTAASVEELVDVCIAGLSDAVRQPAQVRLLVQVMVGAAYYGEVAAVVSEALDASKASFAQHLRQIEPGWDADGAAVAADLFFANADGLMLQALAKAPAGSDSHTAQLASMLRAMFSPPSATSRPS